MSKDLCCPKCSDEYWGESKYAKCAKCGYVFTQKDILEATSLYSLIGELIKVEKEEGSTT